MASDKELSDASVPYGLSDQGGETEPSDSENPRRQKKASSPSAGPSKVEPRKTKASVKFHDGPNDASVHENEKSDRPNKATVGKCRVRFISIGKN